MGDSQKAGEHRYVRATVPPAGTKRNQVLDVGLLIQDSVLKTTGIDSSAATDSLFRTSFLQHPGRSFVSMSRPILLSLKVTLIQQSGPL
jgi:hypothetical protein